MEKIIAEMKENTPISSENTEDLQNKTAVEFSKERCPHHNEKMCKDRSNR